jgi:hypothetical protein
MPVPRKPSQSHLSHTGYLRCLSLDKHGRSLYVSKTAFLSHPAYHTSDYGRSLDGDMPVVGRVLLRDCLAQLHQDIITCWNFEDEERVRYLCSVMRHQNTLTMFPIRSSAMKGSSS